MPTRAGREAGGPVSARFFLFGWHSLGSDAEGVGGSGEAAIPNLLFLSPLQKGFFIAEIAEYAEQYKENLCALCVLCD